MPSSRASRPAKPRPKKNCLNSTPKRNNGFAKHSRWSMDFGAATRRARRNSSVTTLRRVAGGGGIGRRRSGTGFFPDNILPGRKYRRRTAARPIIDQFLQYLSLAGAGEPDHLQAEVRRMAQENFLSADECGVLDLSAIAEFWNSSPGKKIQLQAANVQRELAFTAKFSPQELSKILGTPSAAQLENEFVVVQGVADLIVLLPQEIWLVDFKTDKIHADESAGRQTRIYAPQLQLLYACALSKTYSRPVTNCWLHFLSARRTKWRFDAG